MPSSCVCVCVCRVVVWQSLSKPCDSSAECAPGSECVSLFDEPAFMSLLHSVKLTGDDDGSDLETCGGGAGLQKDVSGPQTQCDGDVGAQQSVQIGRDSLVLGCVLCTVCGWYVRAVAPRGRGTHNRECEVICAKCVVGVLPPNPFPVLVFLPCLLVVPAGEHRAQLVQPGPDGERCRRTCLLSAQP